MTYDCNTGQKMWDPLAIIQAVEGDNLLSLSERGIVTLTPEYGTHFTPSTTGNARYQKPGNDAWSKQILEKSENIL